MSSSSRTKLPEASDFFAMSLDHLCIVDFAGVFLRVNPSWTRTLGWTAEELLGMKSIELVHPDDREKTLVGRSRLHRGESLGPLRNRYRCRDGSYRWFEWRSVAELSRNVVYASARDVTDQIRAEEKLRQAHAEQELLQKQLLVADRMVAVGTLAAGSAHEINNPLAVVSSNLALLLEELSGTAVPEARVGELIHLVQEAQRGAERIRGIVRGLNTFARAREVRPALLDVRQVLEVAVSLTANQLQPRGRLLKQYGETPRILADDGRLGQVFINLLVNATQALAEGGGAQPEIRITTSTDEAGGAVIEVSDTGPGIPAEIISRVFDPFFTTKPVGVGTGLGLPISRNLVEGMGGSLTVRSELGRGTTFRVVLPAAVEGQPAHRPDPAVSESPPTRVTVLVVDDEASVGAALRRTLRDHEVTIFTRASEALDLIEGGKRFDVIFSDLMMPGMSGMEFYAELTRRLPDQARRMVFISGGAFTQEAHAFLDVIPNPRLDKPFDLQAVRALVQRVAALPR